MRIILIGLCCLCGIQSAAAAERAITLFLDGARIEGTATPTGRSARRIEVPLPPEVVLDSVRLRPLAGDAIIRVETGPATAAGSHDKELKTLRARKATVEERLRALETREEIFKAAAKSQSSKAPRRTKTNPEPLAAIRQGTDYALAQLEDVCRQRRRATNELETIDQRLEALGRAEGSRGSVVRVRTRVGKGVAYSYLVRGPGWTPFYDFRVDHGTVDVTLRAILPPLTAGKKVAVAAVRLTEALPATPTIVAPADFAPLRRFRFAVEREQSVDSPQGGARFAFRNASGEGLLPGDGACFRAGEYLGQIRFPGLKPGDVAELVAGK